MDASPSPRSPNRWDSIPSIISAVAIKSAWACPQAAINVHKNFVKSQSRIINGALVPAKSCLMVLLDLVFASNARKPLRETSESLSQLAWLRQVDREQYRGRIE